MFKAKNRSKYQLTIKAYSYLMVLTMIATIIATPFGGLGLWAKADEETICRHVHSAECYAVPEGHECSEEEGCIPVYPMVTVVLNAGHTHDDGCFDYILDEESGEYVLDYDNPICGLTECEAETVEVPDYDAEPVWTCVYSAECWGAPEGHECSEEEGCVPVYPMITEVINAGHTHSDDCFNFILDEESGGYVLDYDNPVCGLTECEAQTQEVPDYNAEPVWNCVYLGGGS